MNYQHRPQCSMCPMFHMCMYTKGFMPNISPEGMLPMYMDQGMQQMPTSLPGTAPEYAENLLPESGKHHKKHKKHHKHHNKHHKHMDHDCKYHGHHSSD
ncbi:MAG TPA: hypothetical protein VHS59_10125 [Bacillota bacterium]|nr:hypothetical protein [Bacillota bacterium]